jgi:hypothetical protein
MAGHSKGTTKGGERKRCYRVPFLSRSTSYTQSSYTTLFPRQIILDKCEMVHSACTLAFLAFQATGRVPCFPKKKIDLSQKFSQHILWWINVNKGLFDSHLDNNPLDETNRYEIIVRL